MYLNYHLQVFLNWNLFTTKWLWEKRQTLSIKYPRQHSTYWASNFRKQKSYHEWTNAKLKYVLWNSCQDFWGFRVSHGFGRKHYLKWWLWENSCDTVVELLEHWILRLLNVCVMTNTSTVVGLMRTNCYALEQLYFLNAIIVIACFGIFLNIIPTYFYFSIILIRQ